MLCLEQTVGPVARQRARSSERGEAVRVVLRRKEQGEKWTALGAEVAVASIEDADAMADALKGASGAFLLNPPPVSGDPYARTEELGAALADAARRARLPKAVVLSSIGAQHASGTGVIATLNRFEALLDGVAPATAFLRSGYFIETWSEVAETVMSESVLPTFLEPSQKIPMVSTIDVDARRQPFSARTGPARGSWNWADRTTGAPAMPQRPSPKFWAGRSSRCSFHRNSAPHFYPRKACPPRSRTRFSACIWESPMGCSSAKTKASIGAARSL